MAEDAIPRRGFLKGAGAAGAAAATALTGHSESVQANTPAQSSAPRATVGDAHQSAMEGFFADPIYGGNRNKVSWRMVG